jgi:hypothetical protein
VRRCPIFIKLALRVRNFTIGDVQFQLAMKDVLRVNELIAWLRARFAFEFTTFDLVIDGVKLDDFDICLEPSENAPLMTVVAKGDVQQRVTFRDMTDSTPFELGPYYFHLSATTTDVLGAFGATPPAPCQFLYNAEPVLTTPDAPLNSVPIGDEMISLKFENGDSPLRTRLRNRASSSVVRSDIQILPGHSADASHWRAAVSPAMEVHASSLLVSRFPDSSALLEFERVEIRIIDRDSPAPTVYAIPIELPLSVSFPDRRVANAFGLLIDPTSLSWTAEPPPLFLVRRPLSLCVHFANGASRMFDVDGDAPLSSFMRALGLTFAFFHGCDGPVTADATLGDVADGVWVFPNASAVAELMVPLLSDKQRFTLRMAPRATVGDLKRLLAERMGPTFGAFVLQHGGVTLGARLPILNLHLTTESPIVVLVHPDAEALPIEDAPAERPADYDELLWRLVEQSRQPLKICQRCFTQHHYRFDETVADLTAPR